MGSDFCWAFDAGISSKLKVEEWAFCFIWCYGFRFYRLELGCGVVLELGWVFCALEYAVCFGGAYGGEVLMLFICDDVIGG